jgi:hypothetical protein
VKRSAGFLVLVIILLVPVCGWGATQIGVRGGYSHASGDLFEGSGDIGGAGIYGVVVSMGLLPRIDVGFAYERYTSSFDFQRAAFQDAFFGGEAEYEDQAYVFTGTLNLGTPGSPLDLYGGGGFSLHEMNLKIKTDDDVGDYLDRIGGDRSDWEWHLVGGLGLRLPSLPFRAYAEYRYSNVQGDDNPTYSSVYGGLNLYLD